MKTRHVEIVFGSTPYNIRVRPEHLDRFYELIRLGVTNRVCKAQVLEPVQWTELWNIMGESWQCMLICSVLEHLTGVSGDCSHDPIIPDKLVDEIISSLSDDE